MALPSNFDLITVHGKYIQFDGAPAVGAVTFTPNLPTGTWLVSTSTQQVILPQSNAATLDSSGAFSVQLPASDDPDVQPTGWTYAVTEKIGGATRTYSITVPVGSPTIELSTVSPVTPVSATVRQVKSVNGVFPDINGNITVAAGGPGVADHGSLTGLADDDHPHYLTQARADTRYAQTTALTAYATTTALTSGLAGKTGVGHVHTIADTTSLQTALDGKAAAAHTHDWSTIQNTPQITVSKDFSVHGAVAVTTGAHRWYNDTGRTLTIQTVRASAGTAPSGAPLTVAVARNGSSLISVAIPDGTNTVKATPAGHTLADGDYVTVNVTGVGSATSGADLTVTITCV